MYGQVRTANYCVPWIRAQYPTGVHPARLQVDMGPHGPVFETHSVQWEVDYFLHLRDYNTAMHSGRQGPEAVSTDTLQSLVRAYQPKGHLIESLSDERHIPEDLIYAPVFRSIAQSVHMKQKHEAECGQQYDVVALQRYDAIVGPRPTSLCQELLEHGAPPMTVLVHGNRFRMFGEAWQVAMDDIFMVGDSVGVDALVASCARLWADPTRETHDEAAWGGPNVYTYRNATLASVDFRKMEAKPAIVRPDAEKRPVFDSWDYHNHFWRSNHGRITN